MIYKSSNPKVVTVDKKGNLRALKGRYGKDHHFGKGIRNI